jgi:uncharacterized protein YdaL
VNPSKAIWFASAVKELISATVALVMVVDCLGLVDNADAQTPSSAGTTNPQCVNVFHDDTTGAKDGKGSINAIYLANLLGHWPAYEVRVRPVQNYKAGMSDACKATFYIGSFESTAVPKAFLHDYFATRRSVVWMGFGTERLDQEQFQRAFAFEPKGKLTARFMPSGPPAFFAHVTYKGSVFNRQAVKTSTGSYIGPFESVNYMPANQGLPTTTVVAEQLNNSTGERKPYILRRGNKFVVADVPFSYLDEGGPYFAFADLLFDVLDEAPRRSERLAFVRIEDIFGFYDRSLLGAAISTLRREGVPISIAHIPVFADPFDAMGLGATKAPRPATEDSEFVALMSTIAQDPRNAIIWHGVTHQSDNRKNTESGASGDDFEFWDAVNRRPIEGDSASVIFNRLLSGFPVFEAYNYHPRYWITPHYYASALANAVFGSVFPWTVGRSVYYPTSVGQSFTLPPADPTTGANMPPVSRDRLQSSSREKLDHLDTRSEDGLMQIFPFEIYRDIYGQRIFPETLNFLSTITANPSPLDRDVPQILADARRNSVVRDYIASFFVHPFIFPKSGDSGSFDTSRLRQTITGLKELGYRFIGLPDFEKAITERPYSAEFRVKLALEALRGEPVATLSAKYAVDEATIASWRDQAAEVLRRSFSNK